MPGKSVRSLRQSGVEDGVEDLTLEELEDVLQDDDQPARLHKAGRAVSDYMRACAKHAERKLTSDPDEEEVIIDRAFWTLSNATNWLMGYQRGFFRITPHGDDPIYVYNEGGKMREGVSLGCRFKGRIVSGTINVEDETVECWFIILSGVIDG